MKPVLLVAAALAAVAIGSRPVAAQDAEKIGPQVGDVAPDFALPAASKDGVAAKQIRLSDLKGKLVVISFFPKARTKG
ncbi:MAG: redoxin domain-containing protein [Gemmatimonadaceae bacterium]|nr:redoxin domain-containing protein [Gemmatimonadaceae bacterium]